MKNFVGIGHINVKKIKITNIINNIGIVMACQLLVYLVQYIFVPIIFKLDPADDEVTSAIIISTTSLISFVVMYRYLDKFRYWIICSPVYYMLVTIYHPRHIYGIDYGFMPKLTIIGIILGVFINQFVVWIIVKTTKYIIRKVTYQKSSKS